MSKSLLAAVSIATLSFSTASYSKEENDQWYLGGIFSKQDIHNRGREFDSIGVLGGYQYSSNISLETRLSFGLSNGYSSFYYHEITDKTFPYKEEINTQLSLLGKFSYPLSDSLTIYGLAGFSRSEFQIYMTMQTYQNDEFLSINQLEKKITEVGVTYGIGVEYEVTPEVTAFVDYQVYPDLKIVSRESNWNSLSVGVSYAF